MKGPSFKSVLASFVVVSVVATVSSTNQVVGVDKRQDLSSGNNNFENAIIGAQEGNSESPLVGQPPILPDGAPVAPTPPSAPSAPSAPALPSAPAVPTVAPTVAPTITQAQAQDSTTELQTAAATPKSYAKSDVRSKIDSEKANNDDDDDSETGTKPKRPVDPRSGLNKNNKMSASMSSNNSDDSEDNKNDDDDDDTIGSTVSTSYVVPSITPYVLKPTGYDLSSATSMKNFAWSGGVQAIVVVFLCALTVF